MVSGVLNLIEFRSLGRTISTYRGHLSAAREFLDAAGASFEKAHLRSLVDNLHSPMELMAKGILLMHDEVMVRGKSHAD
jgi:hypothetical protein